MGLGGGPRAMPPAVAPLGTLNLAHCSSKDGSGSDSWSWAHSARNMAVVYFPGGHSKRIPVLGALALKKSQSGRMGPEAPTDHGPEEQVNLRAQPYLLLQLL